MAIRKGKGDPMVFGERMKKIRNNRGMKQKDVAAITSYCKSQIGALETGRVRPNIDTIIAICDTLQADPLYLLGYRDDE